MSEAPLVLLTGGAGGLGGRLVGVLRGRGWRVRALVHRRPVSGADELARGALEDAVALERAAEGVDAVLHLAAVTHARSPSAYVRVNVTGTGNLLDAARLAGAGRFVHVSTRAISERGGAYRGSKLLAEEAVRSSGLERVIVRLPEVLGAGGSEGVDRIVELARRGARLPVVGAGSEELCPAHVDDVLPALATALTAPAAAGRTYTLAGDCVTVRAFAEACADVFRSPSRPFTVPVSLVRALGVLARVAPLPLYPDQLTRLRAPKPGLSPEATQELDFRPRSLGDALRALAGC